MTEPQGSLRAADLNFANERPATAYFLATFLVSWSAALAVALPHLIRHEPLPRLTGILMFPAMLLGPSLCGLALARWVDGTGGVRDLFARMGRWRIPVRWYALLAVPPALVLGVLFCMRTLVSADYSPNFFLLGVSFGVPAGFFEEIGWMGCAFPKLCLRRSALASSLLLGAMWSLWHLPVINFLGTAVPHGAYWLPFFLVFAGAMTAMRVIISWAYANTKSVLLAQLMHISSTGSLVIFSPPRATAAQEVLWYGIYAVVLWLVAGMVIVANGSSLRRGGNELVLKTA